MVIVGSWVVRMWALMLLFLAAGIHPGVQARPLAEPKPRHLYIAHVNDVHNRIEQATGIAARCDPAAAGKGSCFGGFARISTAARNLRNKAKAEQAAFIFLDAGDEFTGTIWDVVYQGSITAQLQNQLDPKPDAMVLGNHEFDYNGTAGLGPYVSKLAFPMLAACNVDASADPHLKGLLKKWTIIQRNGLRIAVLGWLTPDTALSAKSVGKVKFTAIGAAVAACMKELQAAEKDLDLVIGLSHGGYASDLEVAKHVPGFDMIIGGHSHTFLHSPETGGPITDVTKKNATASNCVDLNACDKPSGPYPTMVKSLKGNTTTPVFQAYWSSKYFGQIKYDFGSKSITYAEPLLLGGNSSSSPVPEDPAMLAAIAKLAGPVVALQTQVAGYITVQLVGGQEPGARSSEISFGSYLADLAAASWNSQPALADKLGPMQIGLINTGVIRASIQGPNVTVGSVLTALPYGNVPAYKAVTGQQLIDSIKWSLQGASINAGRFLQVSGIRIWHRNFMLSAVHLLLPANSTNTTSSTPINATQLYNVAATDYMLTGGDGFTSWAKQPFLTAPGAEGLDALMIADLEAAAPKPVVVPDPQQSRRIINCATVTPAQCSAEHSVYGPCCLVG